eukprot:GHVQ01019858.1.p1 GENE.GHVQ01019858.1~~GHVQ01019858.1.p1  ORF type:complete len:118 (+),score=12.93 GHVQ01019858.1:42-395(+)
MGVCMCVCVYVCVCVCAKAFVYSLLRMCMGDMLYSLCARAGMYVYAGPHTHKHSMADTERETDRYTDFNVYAVCIVYTYCICILSKCVYLVRMLCVYMTCKMYIHLSMFSVMESKLS